MESFETIEYKGYKIDIYNDNNPDSPREWGNLGKMVCWHPRYIVGDTHDFSDPEEFYEYLKENPAIMLPVYGYDHGGLAISTSQDHYPFNDRWDSGQLGYIYVTKEAVREEYKCKRISAKTRDKVLHTLQAEIDVYNDYLMGNVYGYKVINPEGDEISALWGFYGYDHEASGLLDEARSEIDFDIEEVQAHNDMLQLRFDLCF